METNLKNYNFNKLLLLASTPEFYSVVSSEEKLKEYVKCLHLAYCKNNNIKPAKLKFVSLSMETWAQWKCGISENIFINDNLLKAFKTLKETNNSFYPLKLVQVIIHESRHSWQYKNIKNLNSSKLLMSENLAVAALKKAQSLIGLYNKILKNSNQIFAKPKQQQKNLKYKLKHQNDINFMEKEYGFNPFELDANNYSIEVLNYINNNALNSSTKSNILMLKKEICATVEKCSWNIEQEFEALKHSRFKDVLKAYSNVIDNYNSEKREQIYKNKNYSYTSDKYMLDLYPQLSLEAKNIAQIDFKEAWTQEQFMDSGKCVMAVLKASMQPSYVKKR